MGRRLLDRVCGPLDSMGATMAEYEDVNYCQRCGHALEQRAFEENSETNVSQAAGSSYSSIPRSLSSCWSRKAA